MDDTRLSVLDHLEEMRVRMLKSIACVLILFPIFYYFSQPTIEWLLDSFCPQVGQLHFMQPMELFFTRLKVGGVMAVATAYPYIALHIWGFVAPGLYRNERYYVSRFVFVSTGLFLLGAGMALFLVYPMVLRFAVGMATDKITPMLQLRYVVNLASMLMLGFGLMFQLPIVVYLLAVMELVSLDSMKKARPIVVVVIFAASAILTPPDVISQCALGFPSLLLFEISLFFAGRALRNKRRRETEQETAEREEAETCPTEDAAAPPPASPDIPPEAAAEPAAEPMPGNDENDPEQRPNELETADYVPQADEDDWEQWYEHVDEEDFSLESIHKPKVQPGEPDPYDEGPAGSGLV